MLTPRLALRTLFKTPFVTSVAILSLALGIGANAAIFSLFDQMLLRPLPVSDPGHLVNLSAPGPKPGSQWCGNAGDCDDVFSYLMFRDLQRVEGAFTGIAAHVAFGTQLAYQGQTLGGDGMLVSGSYFAVLGLRPTLGRLIGPDDDRSVGASFVVVLSHAYWRTRFDADPDVLNQTLIVNGHPMTIVGVAPRGFEGTTLGTRPQVFVPITMRGLMVPAANLNNTFDNRRSYWAYLFARLKPGVSTQQAHAIVNGHYRSILKDVEAELQKGMSEQTMARFLAKEVELAPGARGQSSLQGEVSTPIILLMTVAGVVLLIACANIANLLLARSATRATEMAVRLSIGASRRQIVTQLLAESCLLAVLGGLCGLVVAQWTLSGIASLLPTETAEAFAFSLDLKALLFAASLSLGTGVLFGLFPALHSTRPDLVSTLKGQTGQPSGARSAARFRTSLATAQIALSMTLLIAAGLFTRSLLNVSRVDLGIRTERLIQFGLAPSLNGYTPERSRQLFQRVEEALAALPGATSVTASSVRLLSGSSWGNDVSVEGFEKGPDTDANSRMNLVGPGYYRTLGIPLLAGREFTEADALGRPQVAVVNETFARKFKLGRDAVGKRMRPSGPGSETELNVEIVGLVQDAKYNNVKNEAPPMYVLPYRQDENIGFMNFYVRTAVDEDRLLTAIPAIVRELDPNLPVNNLRSMEAQVRENIFLDRLITTLSASFALLATLLAAVGLYGVLAYTVAQRTREFGLRMALGADAARMRSLVLGQVGRMTVVGALIGVAAAVGLGRVAQSLLFELEGHDPAVFTLSAVVVTLVALSAGFIPAFRASRLDPMRALRYE